MTKYENGLERHVATNHLPHVQIENMKHDHEFPQFVCKNCEQFFNTEVMLTNHQEHHELILIRCKELPEKRRVYYPVQKLITPKKE